MDLIKLNTAEVEYKLCSSFLSAEYMMIRKEHLALTSFHWSAWNLHLSLVCAGQPAAEMKKSNTPSGRSQLQHLRHNREGDNTINIWTSRLHPVPSLSLSFSLRSAKITVSVAGVQHPLSRIMLSVPCQPDSVINSTRLANLQQQCKSAWFLEWNQNIPMMQIRFRQPDRFLLHCDVNFFRFLRLFILPAKICFSMTKILIFWKLNQFLLHLDSCLVSVASVYDFISAPAIRIKKWIGQNYCLGYYWKRLRGSENERRNKKLAICVIARLCILDRLEGGAAALCAHTTKKMWTDRWGVYILFHKKAMLW